MNWLFDVSRAIRTDRSSPADTTTNRAFCQRSVHRQPPMRIADAVRYSSVPMIGPSMVPMPPITTMKMIAADQPTLKAASGEIRSVPRK